MGNPKKNKGKFIWQLLSIFLAVVLWFVIIQIENPNDSYTIRNIEIVAQNADSLDAENLIFYGFEENRVTVKFVGGKVNLGRLREYEGDITATVDIKNYFTNNKLTTNEGIMLPVVVNVPDKLKNLIKIERQSLEYAKIKIDEKITVIKDVTLNLTSSVNEDIYVQNEKAKVLPQKVELIGAKTLIDQVAEVKVDYNVTSMEDSKANEAKVMVYDKDGKAIDSIIVQPENVQIQVPVLNKKTVKFNLSIMNTLDDKYELEEVKITPNEITVAAESGVYDLIDDVINIQIELEQKAGNFKQTKDIILNDALVNIGDINKVEINYVIKESDKNTQ